MITIEKKEAAIQEAQFEIQEAENCVIYIASLFKIAQTNGSGIAQFLTWTKKSTLTQNQVAKTRLGRGKEVILQVARTIHSNKEQGNSNGC